MQFKLVLFLVTLAVSADGFIRGWNCLGRMCRHKGPFRVPERYKKDPEYIGSTSHSWDYKELDWGRTYSECDGKRQSPIDIPTEEARIEGPPIGTINYKKTPNTLTLKNNGHSVTLYPNYTSSDDAAAVWFNDAVYRLANIHLHWGRRGNGSEHALSGKKGSVEMHMVHSADPGSTPNDKLVVAVILDVDAPGKRLDSVEMLAKYLHRVRVYKSETNIRNVPMSTFFPATPTACYTYEGSLTTPPCSEDVIFCVHRTILPVSERLLHELHTILNEENTRINKNFRPLQDLNGREVSYSTMVLES